MDKVKAFFATLKKQQFWVGSALLLVIAGATWFLSTKELAAATAKNTSEIDGKLKAAKDVAVKPEHPNQTFIEGKQKEIAAQNATVKEAWKNRYDEQAAKLYLWPEALGEDFLAEMKRAETTNTELPQKYKEMYQDHVKTEVERLAKFVNSTYNAAATGDRRVAAGEEMAAKDPDYMVVWAPENQLQILKSLTFNAIPNTEKIRLAQQNIWMYEALLKLVVDTNEGARGHYEAPIKQLQLIAVGRDATGKPFLPLTPFTPGGRGESPTRVKRNPKKPATVGAVAAVTPVADPSAAGATPTVGGPPFQQPDFEHLEKEDPSAAPGAGAAVASPGGYAASTTVNIAPGPGVAPPPAATGAPTAAEKPTSLFDWRFVDNSPGPGWQRPLYLREMETQAQKLSRQLPFRMKFTIDQRALGKFLKICGEASLPIEVREFRFNPPGEKKSTEAPVEKYDVAVEVYGVIYLMNKVDPNVFVDAKAPVAADPTAVPPATGTAPPVDPAAPATSTPPTTPAVDPSAVPATNPAVPAANGTVPAANGTVPPANGTVPPATTPTPPPG